MKKIVAIGSLDTFPYVLNGCFGTLSRYTSYGDETYLLITLDVDCNRTDQERLRLESIQRAAKRIGISMILFIEGFNHEEVSQRNVSLLRSVIEPINPSVVLMPFRNAVNSKQSVLGSSAFLACRWIANILSYEIDRNSNFTPTVFSNLSDKECALKQESIQEFNSNDTNNNNLYMNKSGEMEQTLYNKAELDAKRLEMFESHRLVLLSANDIV